MHHIKAELSPGCFLGENKKGLIDRCIWFSELFTFSLKDFGYIMLFCCLLRCKIEPVAAKSSSEKREMQHPCGFWDLPE